MKNVLNILTLAAIILVGTTSRPATYSPSWTIVANSFPRESKTNSTTAEQDFTAVYTIPAGNLVEGKIYRVSLGFQYTSGTSSATVLPYVEMGGVKVLTNAAGTNLADGQNRTNTLGFLIQGTEAAAESAAVEIMVTLAGGNFPNTGNGSNSTVQPVGLATTGDLSIVPGIQYSATGSTETFLLRTVLIEESN